LNIKVNVRYESNKEIRNLYRLKTLFKLGMQNEMQKINVDLIYIKSRYQ